VDALDGDGLVVGGAQPHDPQHRVAARDAEVLADPVVRRGGFAGQGACAGGVAALAHVVGERGQLDGQPDGRLTDE